MDRARIYKGVTVSTVIAVISLPKTVKASRFIELKSVVKKIEPSKIPQVMNLNITSKYKKYKVFMEMHENLMLFREGDEVLFGIYFKKPVFKEDDFLGRGIVFKVEKDKVYISIGGFLTVVEGKMKTLPSVGSEVYVKLSKIS